MSLNALDTQVWHECQRVLQNPRLRRRDVLEWSAGNVSAQEGEIIVHLESLGVNVAVLAVHDRRELLK